MTNTDVDAELSEFLQERMDSGALGEEEDRNAIGVARQVVYMDYHSLSLRQKGLYKAEVAPATKAIAKAWKANETAYRYGND